MIKQIPNNLVRLLVRSRPYLLGFVSGIVLSITVLGVNAFKEPVNYNIIAPAPFTENLDPDWDFAFMSYAGGVVNSRSDRYYHRGMDWIMIKDFPLIIDDYQAHYKDVSDDLWGSSPSKKGENK